MGRENILFQQVPYTQFLGAILGECLNWREHLQSKLDCSLYAHIQINSEPKIIMAYIAQLYRISHIRNPACVYGDQLKTSIRKKQK